MLQALLYLNLKSAENLVKAKLGRLRQPKYLLGAGAAGAYIYFFFIRRIFSAPSSQAAHAFAAGGPMLAPSLGALLLFAFIAFAWIMPSDKPGLTFTEPEIAFLFSAPLARKSLINYKIIGSQARILFSSVVLTLITNRTAPEGGNGFTHAIGWWLILSFTNLHSMASSLTISRLAEDGIGAPARRAAVLAAFVAIVAVVIGSAMWPIAAIPPATRTRVFVGLGAAFGIGVGILSRRFGFKKGTRGFVRLALAAAALYLLCILGLFLAPAPDPSPVGSGSLDAVRELCQQLDAGLLHWILWPLKLVIAPYTSETTREFLLALLPSAAMVLLTGVWVKTLEVSFEDASIAAAERRSAMIASARAGRLRFGTGRARRDPFRLHPTGAPEIAFLWKNLLSTRPYFTPRIFGACAVILYAVITFYLQHSDHAQRHAIGTLVFAGFALAYLLILGPQFARQDLRSDLSNLDILKAYPLPGWRLILGQMMTPLAILTGCGWLTIVAAYAGARALPANELLGSHRALATAVVACLLAVPVVVAVQLLVTNAVAVLFPAWQMAAAGRGQGNGGFELVGQRLLLSLGRMFVLLFFLGPPVALGGLSLFTSWLFGPVVAMILCAASSLGLLAVELFFGLWWIGRRFDRLDFTTETRA